MKKRVRSLDPRLALGLALVIASVAGVWAIVATADETVEVYAASEPIAPGDVIRERDLEIERVRLSSTSRYLTPGEVPSDGLVATRVVGEGELVPASATSGTSSLRAAAIVLTVEGQLPAAVDAGAVVDVWAARATDVGDFGEPKAIASGAIVVRLVESQSIVGAGETVAVEVLVDRSRVARVLAAIANDDAIALVPGVH